MDLFTCFGLDPLLLSADLFELPCYTLDRIPCKAPTSVSLARGSKHKAKLPWAADRNTPLSTQRDSEPLPSVDLPSLRRILRWLFFVYNESCSLMGGPDFSLHRLYAGWILVSSGPLAYDSVGKLPICLIARSGQPTQQCVVFLAGGSMGLSHL